MKSFLATCLAAILVLVPAHAKGPLHGQPPPGAAAQGKQLVTTCTACHGGDGIGMTPAYPNLAGQSYGYILKQLQDFRDGKRASSIMGGMAKTIPASPGDRDLEDIAAYFHQMKPMWTVSAPAATSPDAQRRLGKTLFTRGDHADRIPACAACHGLAGEGNGPMATPSLAGQHAAYIVAQLQQFASGKRNNSTGHVMYTIARKLTSKQVSAVAAYVQDLNPGTTLGIGPKDFVEFTRSAHAAQAREGTGTNGSAPASASSSHE